MANLIAIHAIGIKDRSKLAPTWNYADPGSGYTQQNPVKLIAPGATFSTTELDGGTAEGASLVASGAARWA